MKREEQLYLRHEYSGGIIVVAESWYFDILTTLLLYHFIANLNQIWSKRCSYLNLNLFWIYAIMQFFLWFSQNLVLFVLLQPQSSGINRNIPRSNTQPINSRNVKVYGGDIILDRVSLRYYGIHVFCLFEFELTVFVGDGIEKSFTSVCLWFDFANLFGFVFLTQTFSLQKRVQLRIWRKSLKRYSTRLC